MLKTKTTSEYHLVVTDVGENCAKYLLQLLDCRNTAVQSVVLHPLPALVDIKRGTTQHEFGNI
jgi:hypothetical protein